MMQTDDMMMDISFIEWLELKTQRDALYGALISIIVDHEIAVANGEPARLTQSDYEKADAALFLAHGKTEMPSPFVRSAMRKYWVMERSRSGETA